MKHDPISELRRYAADLEAEVSADRARAAASRALFSPTPARRGSRRAMAAIVATALMGISNVALAGAADPAVPGDTLYGVDRAYESIGSAVGFTATHASERADEVLVLQERGKSSEALQHVIESLTELLEADDPVEAVEEFTAAFDNSAVNLGPLMDVVRGTTTTGSEIAAVAREIAKSLVLPGQAEGTPGGPPDGRGKSQDPGNGNPNPGVGTPTDRGQGAVLP